MSEEPTRQVSHTRPRPHLRHSTTSGIVRYSDSKKVHRFSQNAVRAHSQRCGCVDSLLPPQVIDVERHDCFGARLFRSMGATEAAVEWRVSTLIATVRGIPYEVFSVMLSISTFVHLLVYATNLSAEDDVVNGVTVSNSTGAVISTADDMPAWMIINFMGACLWFVPVLLTMNVPLTRFSMTSFFFVFALYNIARWMWAFCSSHTSWRFTLCKQ